MLHKLFRPRSAARSGEALYALAVEQARRPAFYAEMGVPDRIDARFDLYTLHVMLLVQRLRELGEEGGETAQALFDTFVSALDHALRELGVGDITVGKKMRKLGEQLYGRMTAYETPLKDGDREALAAALARNVLDGEIRDGGALADYALASRDRLAQQDLQGLKAGPDWAPLSTEATEARA